MDKLKEHTSDELIAKLQRETGFSQGRILIKTAREILGGRDYRELLANEGTEARAVEKGGYLYIFSKL